MIFGRCVIRYLKTIAHYSFKNFPGATIQLTAYVDINWEARIERECKKRTGRIAKYKNAMIHGSSCIQQSFTLSSSEYKYLALANASCTTSWLRTVLAEMKSSSVVRMSTKKPQAQFSIHVEFIEVLQTSQTLRREASFVKHLIGTGTTSNFYIPTPDMKLGVLMKAIGSATFILVSSMGFSLFQKTKVSVDRTQR